MALTIMMENTETNYACFSQENNAVVQVNLDPGNESITAINSMGTKSWFQYNLDATNAPQREFLD